ncbi:MAG: Sensor kinase CusS [Syntrophorhabdaceae bacterium PtaU1.Bin034]|jgi:heavy metal sensor kinase|nr:MAG: Sensor kinase CusS [Syntrophorhabdaceae bacterium PtaU1.Bin034]
MRRLSNLPIRWRLTILNGVILSLILVVFSGGVYIYFRNSLQKSIDAKIKSMGDVISSSMTDVHDPSLFGNFERYLENVLGRKPKGRLIQIMDSSGRIGAKSNDIETENMVTSFATIEQAKSGEIVYETLERTRPRLRVITIPILENKKVTSIVQVGTSLEDFDETTRRLLMILIIGIPTSISVIIGVGYYMAKKSLKPVDQIRKTAIKISSRNLDEYIDIGPRKDELGKLAETFNDMISRLRDAFQRINQFSIDVSHELKTPLTILKGGTEVALRKDRESREYKVLLASHLEEIDRMSTIIDDLLLLSKADTGKMQLSLEEVEIKDLIMEVYMDMKIFAEKKDVDLVVGDLNDTKLKGDDLKLRRMLWNIVDNGIKYTQTGGKVEISTAIDDGYIRINVRDTGVGIADADIKYIFDRFYRADRARTRESGTGLGLSISKWIAEAHKGTIEVESAASIGTVFSVKLPVTGGSA